MFLKPEEEKKYAFLKNTHVRVIEAMGSLKGFQV